MRGVFTILSAAMLSLVGSPAAAQQGTAQAGITIEAQDQKDDLELLRHVLVEAHPSLHRYASQQLVDQEFEEALAAANTSRKIISFYGEVARLVATVRDGHTSAYLPDEAREAFDRDTLFIPARFYIRGQRLYLREVLPHSVGSDLPGREVLKIAGKPAVEVIADLMGMVPGDGAISASRAHYLNVGLQFNRYYAVRFGTVDKTTIAFSDGQEITLEGQEYRTLADSLFQSQPNGDSLDYAEVEFRDDNALAVLTIRSFRAHTDSERAIRMEAFFEDAFASMADQGTNSLILDLRGNSGGRDMLGRLLLQYLADKPFKYYRRLSVKGTNFSFAEHLEGWPVPIPEGMFAAADDGRLNVTRHPNLGTHSPMQSRFEGETFILMDGGSYSTTAEFLAMASHLDLAVFIGAESGGGYQGNTSGVMPQLILPNSKIAVRLPLVRYDMAVVSDSQRTGGVLPDHEVIPTIAELKAGIDLAMELALEMASDDR